VSTWGRRAADPGEEEDRRERSLWHITLDDYRHVRMDPRRFAVVPEHLIGDIERIVYENDRFAVVAKREGVPADVARDENPRGYGRYPRGGRTASLSLESRS